jgi:hypothetical protein
LGSLAFAFTQLGGTKEILVAELWARRGELEKKAIATTTDMTAAAIKARGLNLNLSDFALEFLRIIVMGFK